MLTVFIYIISDKYIIRIDSVPHHWDGIIHLFIKKCGNIIEQNSRRNHHKKCAFHPKIHPFTHNLEKRKYQIDRNHCIQIPQMLFSGEIGELHGVRFVETTEAKIYRGEDLAADSRTLKVNGNVMASTDVTFNGGTVAAGALAGRYVVLGGTRCQVVSNTDAKLVLDKTVTVGDKEVIYPGEGGKQGCAVYGCLFLGKGAYGVVDLSEGTEVIVKPRGSSGTADPLDQRSSVGWKGVHAAAILYDEYMVRVECGSSYSDEDKAN